MGGEEAESLEKFQPFHSTPLTLTGGTKRTKQIVTLFSGLNSDETILVLGTNNDDIVTADPTRLSLESLTISNTNAQRHSGLSCIRCSKSEPSLFYSSSSTEGSVFLWDVRTDQRKPTQKFTTKGSAVGGESGSGAKPILNFDISSGEQLLCAGTELVEEDSYLLFWDTRSSVQPLGAYWESHSDDITSVKFHPSTTHSLASGSTDGLLNVFDLTQTKEEDALIYSFNSESSVESIAWRSSKSSNEKTLVCLTHTNDVKIWDGESGDPIQEFSRGGVMESVKRSSSPEPDALQLLGCFDTKDAGLGILVSISGDYPHFLELSDDNKLLRSRSLLMNQNQNLQTAQFISKSNAWITSDDKGFIQVWSSKLEDEMSAKLSIVSNQNQIRQKKKHTRAARFKPYPNTSE